MPLKVAHIGAGRFSRSAHAPVLQRLVAETSLGIRLDGIADLDPTRPERAEALARDFGYQRAFAEWRRMIATIEPDLLVCTVEPAKTASLLREVLPLGIPILVEKPQSLTMAEAEVLVDLARSHRATAYVAFNRRRIPAIEYARLWSQRRAPLEYLKAEMFRTRPVTPGFSVRTAVHAFDTVRYLAGEATHIYTSKRPSGVTCGTGYSVTLRMRTGAVAEVSVVGGQDSNREVYVLHSGAMRLEATVGPPYSSPPLRAGVRLFHHDRVAAEMEAPEDHLVSIGMMPQYRRFLACVAGDAPLDCSLADARHSLLIAAAAEAGCCGALRECENGANPGRSLQNEATTVSLN